MIALLICVVLDAHQISPLDRVLPIPISMRHHLIWVCSSPMNLVLAPMEGLLDFVLRDTLTRVGGVDRCVSEFIRVTNTLLPDRLFYRVVPELHNHGLTPSGIPVRPQLLGSDASCLGDNAARIARLSPFGVDLNFGCPAKVVNRHGGGASLLDDPDLLLRIMSAVRRSVPADKPTSAKMRLGVNDDRLAVECALALEEGGATEIVVHARTKADAYRPPAYWHRIADIKAAIRIPIIANGEIWTLQDAAQARAESGCDSLMLGRGIVTNPALAWAIRGEKDSLPWPVLLSHMAHFWQLVCKTQETRQQAGRLKQWLNFLRRHYPEAQLAFAAIRTINAPAEIDRWMLESGWPR